jgi:TRAP-type C4-dicarboxylate transport system substrate-binding protein
MKKTAFKIALMAGLFVVLTPLVFAQRGGRSHEILEVKMASPLPKESPWGKTLDRLAVEWGRITGNQVRLRVLHSGTVGGEGKMLLSLASNAIQAAAFTSFGISAIEPSVMTLSAPFLIRNDAELDTVLPQIQPQLEEQFNRTKYIIIAWSRVGWVNVFSKEPVFTPDDLRKQKIATNADSEDLNTAFKTMGFQLVETDFTDVGPKLMSGTITAIYQNPVSVSAYRLHDYLKNMLSINIAPFMGGFVANKITWEKIEELNPRYPQELIRATRRIVGDLDTSMRQKVADAITGMTRDGLKVNRPSPAQEQIWYDDVERVVPVLLGTTFNREIYQKISAILTARRNGR